jgi:hypothetical protein
MNLLRRFIADILDCWAAALRLASGLIYVEPAPVCAPTVQDIWDEAEFEAAFPNLAAQIMARDGRLHWVRYNPDDDSWYADNGPQSHAQPQTGPPTLGSA